MPAELSANFGEEMFHPEIIDIVLILRQLDTDLAIST